MESAGVTVYNYRTYSFPVENVQVTGHKATLDAIRRLGGEPIAGTAEEVSRSDLDEQGIYRRLPTGWGELTQLT